MMVFNPQTLHPAAASGPYSLWPRASKRRLPSSPLGRAIDVRKVHPASITPAHYSPHITIRHRAKL
ncbi:hypothetical protein GGI15_000860 [Coemansia interrupta]|uniref:Uncharacterized protein n=1 Tax=Coemansia interrupta TaxID=1126814 RepID=A0A9W8HL43_9FUNG|nr:hypothetical protein GGI15_000860 [Coemansia interrupta]